MDELLLKLEVCMLVQSIESYNIRGCYLVSHSISLYSLCLFPILYLASQRRVGSPARDDVANVDGVVTVLTLVLAQVAFVPGRTLLSYYS